MSGKGTHSGIIRHLWHILLVSSILLVGSSFLFRENFLFTKVTYAQTGNIALPTTTCPSPAGPTTQSLLIVVLDRSGSLTFQPGATDPNLYSTSVTKALADLWPGNMAVIPFSNGQTPLLGPAKLSDLTQATDLKQKVESYPIGGDTPLEPALQGALDLLHQQNTPPGSRIVLITDGNPTGSGNNDGAHQEQKIRQSLISQFCSQGVPVTPFGLTIDSTSSDGQDANRLLTDIATGTSTTYTNVKGPEDLAREVISLFAQWQGLNFTQVQAGNGRNYPVPVDTFAKRVSFVAFRSDNAYTVKLIGPDTQTITQGFQQSTDRHYTIDTLDSSGALVAGTYTINTGGDPNAQVYALVNSPLKLQLVEPTTSTVAHDDQSVTVQTQFLNDQGSVTPESGAAQVVAVVTLLVNGRPSGPPPNTVVLTQQKNAQGSLGPIFSGGTLVYHQPGELQIVVKGTYQQAQRETSFTIPLLKPPVKVIPPPPPDPRRFIPYIIGTGITLGLLALLALIAWLFIVQRRQRPQPYGYITNGRRNGDVALDRFTKPVISSHDIQTRGLFNFSSNFEIVFGKDGTVKIRSNTSGVTVEVPGKMKPEEVTAAGVELKPGKKIYTNGYKAASFETAAGRLWT